MLSSVYYIPAYLYVYANLRHSQYWLLWLRHDSHIFIHFFLGLNISKLKHQEENKSHSHKRVFLPFFYSPNYRQFVIIRFYSGENMCVGWKTVHSTRFNISHSCYSFILLFRYRRKKKTIFPERVAKKSLGYARDNKNLVKSNPSLYFSICT